MLIRTALITGVLALTATTSTSPLTSCDKPGTTTSTSTPTSTRKASTPPKAAVDSNHGGDVEFEAECDTNNHAVHVKPNTKAARTQAERMCQKTGSAIDNAPWPDSLHPTPLPTR